MTQTVLSQAQCKRDVKVSNNLKRKDLEEMQEEQPLKKTLHELPVRSRINADTELWNTLTVLSQDARTSGVIPRLKPNFNKADTVSVYLCSPAIDHLQSGFMDLGWGCGYRNFQMLMTYLERHVEDDEPLLKQVVDIQSIQLLIEKAWKEGFDSLGAAQLEHHVFKTRKWIGATEVYTVLSYLGIRSTIIDFHQPGPERLHKEMMDWIQSYFTPVQSSTKKTVYITSKPPLYLQHQGHSRTVIGIELLESGKRNLIMFDPGRRILRSHSSSTSRNMPPQNYKESDDEEESEEEVVKEEEEEEEEEEIDILNHQDPVKKPSLRKRFMSKITPGPLPTSVLRPYRVDDKTIAKNKQYQILVLGHVEYQKDGKMHWDSKKTLLLNEQERELMKNVTSLTVL